MLSKGNNKITELRAILQRESQTWCQILLSRILTFDYVSWLQHFKNVQLFKTFMAIVYLRNQNVKAIDNNCLFYYGRNVVADAPWS
jgi:hypothetical protein